LKIYMPFLVYHLLKINAREVEFTRRGFTSPGPQIQARLENIGRVFLRGYHSALRERDQNALAAGLDQVDLEHRGFAYEGAAMALALLDELSFRGDALPRFIAGAGRQHVFMLHVGAGWAYARVPWRRHIETAIAGFHPVLRWLVVDGFGFHEGYFHGRSQSRIAASTARLSVEARHVFYQGLGRSLWFSCGAGLREILRAISNIPLLYREDAWSGVGLACAYAGGVTADEIAVLLRESGEWAPAMAQGAAFAAGARQLAGNPAAHTEMACAVLCGRTQERAAALCDETLALVNSSLPCPYQHWRKLLQESLLLGETSPQKPETVFHR
jgi:enediyne biosynthesis protein E3